MKKVSILCTGSTADSLAIFHIEENDFTLTNTYIGLFFQKLFNPFKYFLVSHRDALGIPKTLSSFFLINGNSISRNGL